MAAVAAEGEARAVAALFDFERAPAPCLFWARLLDALYCSRSSCMSQQRRMHACWLVLGSSKRCRRREPPQHRQRVPTPLTFVTKLSAQWMS